MIPYKESAMWSNDQPRPITPAMTSDRLIQRLRQLYGLDEATAAQIIAELMDAWDQTPADFIEQRHQELQRQGLSGQECYVAIQEELEQRRFKAPALTLRQIRRRIYG